jgi:NADH-quinone oxidoreductase subunit G
MNLPKIKPEEMSSGEDKLIEVGWEEAVSKSVSLLTGKKLNVLFIASPYSTLEDNYTLKKFANEVFGCKELYYIPNTDETFGDDILRKSDKTPNSTGLKVLGINPLSDAVIKQIHDGKFKAIYVLNESIERNPELANLISKFEVKVFHLNKKNKFTWMNADVIFSESSYAEINGTFMNFQGRIQRIRPAIATLEQERLLGEYSLSRLDKFGAPNDRWTKDNRVNARPTWKILKQIAMAFGKQFKFDNSEEVFMEMCKVELGIDLDYDKIGSAGYLVNTEKV